MCSKLFVMSFARTSPWWLKCALFVFIETRHFFVAPTVVTDNEKNDLIVAHASVTAFVCCVLVPSLIVGVRSRMHTNQFVCESLMYISCMCLLIAYHSHTFLDYVHMVCCVMFCWVHFLFCAWQKVSTMPHVLLGGALLRLSLLLGIIPIVLHFVAFTRQLGIFDFSFLCILFAGEIVGNVSNIVNQIALHLIRFIIHLVC